MKNNKKVNKDDTYNKKRKPILRVEGTTADTDEDIAEMEQMKVDLIKQSETAKKGVIDMYRFCKQNNFFDKKDCNSRVHDYNQTNLNNQVK